MDQIFAFIRSFANSDITQWHFLALSSILFLIGIYGVLTRKNLIAVLMSVEIMMRPLEVALLRKVISPSIPLSAPFLPPAVGLPFTNETAHISNCLRVLSVASVASARASSIVVGKP